MKDRLSTKNILMLLSIFVMFFSFNIEVKAATAGKCRYELTGDGGDQNANGYFLLEQDKNGKHTYKYKVKGKGAKWVTIKNGKKINSGGKNKRMKREFTVKDGSGVLGSNVGNECPNVWVMATDENGMDMTHGGMFLPTKVFRIYISGLKTNCSSKEQLKRGYERIATANDAAWSYGTLKEGDKIPCKYTDDFSDKPNDNYWWTLDDCDQSQPGNCTGKSNSYFDYSSNDENTFKNAGKTFNEVNCAYSSPDKKYTFLAKQSKKGKWSYGWAYYLSTNFKSIKDSTRFDNNYLFVLRRDDLSNISSSSECPSAVVRTPDSLGLSDQYILDFKNPTTVSGDTYNTKVEEGKVDERAMRMIEGRSINEINSGLITRKKTKKKCVNLLSKDLRNKIQEIVNMIRIMVPILLIVFGIIDFGKAIFVSDENEMKKAQSKFIRRLVIAVGFFLVPSLLALVLKIAHSVWNVIPSAEDAFCGIKF